MKRIRERRFIFRDALGIKLILRSQITGDLREIVPERFWPFSVPPKLGDSVAFRAEGENLWTIERIEDCMIPSCEHAAYVRKVRL